MKGFTRILDAPFDKQLLDVPVTQGRAVVEQDSMTDD